MNRYIYKSEAISYLIGTIALILLCGLWPLGFIHRSLSVRSDTASITESKPATEESMIAQVFVADGNRLEYVDVFVCDDDPGQMDFAIYDGEFNRLYHKEFEVEEKNTPGYVRINTRLKLDRGMPYIYSVYGMDKGITVGLEDHYSTSNLSLYTVNYAGDEDSEHNICTGFKFSIGFKWWQIIIFDLFIIILAVAVIFMVLMYYGRTNDRFVLRRIYNRGADRQLPMQRFVAYIFDPVIALCTIVALYTIFPRRLFGDDINDIFILYAGTILLALLLLYMINRKRTVKGSLEAFKYLKEHIGGWCTSISLAVMLWYCFEYMNGLYDIHHSYAYRRVLTWFFITMITTYGRDELLKIANLVWVVAGIPAVIILLRIGVIPGEDELLGRLTATTVFVGGFVAINIVLSVADLIKGKKKAAGFAVVPLLLNVIFVVGIIVLSNTRTWPFYLVSVMLILTFRLCIYDKRDRWLEYLCNGVILNYAAMVIFSLMHRPYHAYIYHRYDMTYFTVTMTATHLTLCLAAASVRLYIRYKNTKDRKCLLPDMMLFGAVACHLLFTLSRTGYAAAIAMLVFGLFFVAVRFEKKRLMAALLYAACMLLSTVVMFPIVFSATRTIPAVVDDPVIYEPEPCIGTIYKGTEPDDFKYMGIKRFTDVFGSKVLNVGDTLTYNDHTEDIFTGDKKQILMADAFESDCISSPLILLSSEMMTDEGEEEEDVSNGRVSIYKSYIEQMNMWGHDSMGAILEDGSEAAHAHNIFLQSMYDHGLVFGIYFAVYIICMLGLSIYRVCKKDKEDYEIFTIVAITGFIVAGMVEWIFHPCNPYGLTVFLAIVPMLFRLNVTAKTIK